MLAQATLFLPKGSCISARLGAAEQPLKSSSALKQRANAGTAKEIREVQVGTWCSFLKEYKSLQVFLASVIRTPQNFSLQSPEPGEHRAAGPGSLWGQEGDPQLSKERQLNKNCCAAPTTVMHRQRFHLGLESPHRLWLFSVWFKTHW